MTEELYRCKSNHNVILRCDRLEHHLGDHKSEIMTCAWVNEKDKRYSDEDMSELITRLSNYYDYASSTRLSTEYRQPDPYTIKDSIIRNFEYELERLRNKDK